MSEFKTNMPLLHTAGVIELSSKILAHNIPVRSLYRYELLDWFFPSGQSPLCIQTDAKTVDAFISKLSSFHRGNLFFVIDGNSSR